MEIKRVSTELELEEILDLQQANLRKFLGDEAADREGFVTAEYTLSFLQRLHAAEPSIIAVEQGRVVGYALVALREPAVEHPLLADLFRQIDACRYRERFLHSYQYLVVGQLCVARAFRGRGLVRAMYDFYCAELSPRYELCLADVDERNARSIQAHLAAGFNLLQRINYGGSGWWIVLWDWRRS